jgi:hypothetical protein
VLFAVPALGPSWGNGCPNGDTHPITTRSDSSGRSSSRSAQRSCAWNGGMGQRSAPPQLHARIRRQSHGPGISRRIR